MSTSPGAYVTSLPQQTWIKITKGKLFWYVYGTFTASTTYYTIPPWHETPLGVGNTVNILFNVIVTSVSGTSPSMSITINWIDPVAYLNGVTAYTGGVLSTGSITSTGLYSYTASLYGYFAFMVSVSISGTSPSFTAYIDLQIVS